MRRKNGQPEDRHDPLAPASMRPARDAQEKVDPELSDGAPEEIRFNEACA